MINLTNVPTATLIYELGQRRNVEIVTGHYISIKTERQEVKKIGPNYTVVIINDTDCRVKKEATE
jgi:hypothetical protein